MLFRRLLQVAFYLYILLVTVNVIAAQKLTLAAMSMQDFSVQLADVGLPGGASMCAYADTMAISLSLKVVKLTIHGGFKDRVTSRFLLKGERIRKKSLFLMQKDVDNFAKVVELWSKGNGREKGVDATKLSILVPQEIMNLSLQILQQDFTLSSHIDKHYSSDLIASALLAQAAMLSAGAIIIGDFDMVHSRKLKVHLRAQIKAKASQASKLVNLIKERLHL